MIKHTQSILERQLFGVCTWIADKMGLPKRNVRLSFIYLSFLTFGSPVFVYLVIHFWRKHSYIFKPWTWGRPVSDL